MGEIHKNKQEPSGWQWIRFEAHHGGGHQGHTIKYKAYEIESWGVFDDDAIQAILDDWCNDNFRTVKATAELVDRKDIPQELIDSLIDDAVSSIKHYERLLEELR